MFDPKLLLPEQIYALPGFEINIYFRNIVTVINPANYAFDVECEKGRCDQERWRWIPAPEDVVTVDWGNGILFDEDKVWADYLDMVARGLIKPEIALGWRFGMPTETEADLAKIREKYMPEAEKMVEDGDGDE